MGWFDEQIRQRIQNDDDILSDAYARMANAVSGNKKIEIQFQSDREMASRAVGEILKYYRVHARKLPENIDDPNDAHYEVYFVLQEQVAREEDADVLKDAALNNSDYDMAAFAFCRLTGYSFPSSECDAYSYRTFSCDIMPGMTEESIREFCMEVIEKGDRFKEAAQKYLYYEKLK